MGSIVEPIMPGDSRLSVMQRLVTLAEYWQGDGATGDLATWGDMRALLNAIDGPEIANLDTGAAVRAALQARNVSPLGGDSGLALDFVDDVLFLRSAAGVTMGSASAAISFARASGGSYVDGGGIRQWAGSNAPRLDHDPVTGAPRGLLIEAARTNLLLASASPATQTVAVTATAHTLSFHGTGSVALSGASTAGPLVGTGAGERVSLTFTPLDGALVLTVSGAVADAQLEVGEAPSSWIPTTGAAATRAADTASIAVSAFPFDEAEFSVLVEASSTVLPSGDTSMVYNVGPLTGLQGRLAGAVAGANLRTLSRGGTGTTNFSNGAIATGEVFRLAATFRQDVDIRASGKGGAVQSGATHVVDAPLIGIGRGGIVGTGAANQRLNGHLRKLIVVPRRLGDAALQAWSTLP